MLGALLANPEVWSKTVLFHMYDESYGFFYYVAPPTAAPGTAGEYLTQGSLPPPDAPAASRDQSAWASGCRCSCSLPSAGGATSLSDVFDHTSQLRFLEERFGVRAPNISAWRRQYRG